MNVRFSAISPGPSRSLRRSTFTAVVGTLLDNYDLVLFAHLLSVISVTFFPSGDTADKAALWLYALGFAFRPLGGVIFGHLSDRFGRGKGMIISMMLMSVPTLTIALLPGYESIGMAAVVIICLCRLMQSFCFGAEFPQAMTVMVENASASRKGLGSSLEGFALYTGAIFGAVSAWFFTQPFMPYWAWRLAFILGSFIAVFGLYMRLRVAETPDFELAVKENRILKFPLLETLKKDWFSHICYAGIASGWSVIYSNTIVYGPHTARKVFGFDTNTALKMTVLVMGVSVLCFPLFGMLADKIGPRKVIAGGIVSSCLAVIMSFRAADACDLYSFILFQLLASVCFAAQAAPSSVVTKYMYPTERRCSGVSFASGIAAACFGGFSPVILDKLKDLTGGFWGPSYWAIACQICSLLGLYFAPSLLKRKNSI